MEWKGSGAIGGSEPVRRGGEGPAALGDVSEVLLAVLLVRRDLRALQVRIHFPRAGREFLCQPTLDCPSRVRVRVIIRREQRSAAWQH